MRIAVIGAGSLGGLYGGQLVRAGNDVTFVARGVTLETMKRDGLTVKSDTMGDFAGPVQATDDPAGVGVVDLVLLGVKTYDLDAAVTQMAPMVGEDTVVLTMQNGIATAERVNALLGGEKALTGVAYVNAAVESPGVIRQITAVNQLIVGDPGGGRSERADRVAAALAHAGIPVATPDDVRVPMWEKFILLAGTGGVLALTRLPLGPIRASKDMWELFVGSIWEADAVGRALGIAMAPDIVEKHETMVLGLPEGTRSSMLQDVVSGRRLELEALNGAVVRLGRELGVPTPLNLAIYAGLQAYVHGPPAA